MEWLPTGAVSLTMREREDWVGELFVLFSLFGVRIERPRPVALTLKYDGSTLSGGE